MSGKSSQREGPRGECIRAQQVMNTALLHAYRGFNGHRPMEVAEDGVNRTFDMTEDISPVVQARIGRLAIDTWATRFSVACYRDDDRINNAESFSDLIDGVCRCVLTWAVTSAIEELEGEGTKPSVLAAPPDECVGSVSEQQTEELLTSLAEETLGRIDNPHSLTKKQVSDTLDTTDKLHENPIWIASHLNHIEAIYPDLELIDAERRWTAILKTAEWHDPFTKGLWEQALRDAVFTRVSEIAADEF